MRLIKIEAWEVSVPLLQEWASSPEFGEHGSREDGRLVLALHDEHGGIGWGEGKAISRTLVEQAAARLLKEGLSASRLCQVDLFPADELYWSRPASPSPFAPCPENLRHRLRHPMQNVIEMAWTDLRARRLGIPVADLLGGAWRDWVETDYWMGRVTPEQARRCVRRARELGFLGIKLKTTLEDPNLERLEAIQEESTFPVTVDSNGRFYRLADALPTLRRMDAVGNMAILEDPFPRFHLQEFAELRQHLQARVVVHVDPAESLWSVLRSGAADGLNLDSKEVGLFQWRVLAGTAEQANLSIWHGSGLDLGIATAAQLHLAASAPNCRLPGDQAGPWLREHSLLSEPFEICDGKIRVPIGPGLGIEPDSEALDRYAHWNQVVHA